MFKKSIYRLRYLLFIKGRHCARWLGNNLPPFICSRDKKTHNRGKLIVLNQYVINPISYLHVHFDSCPHS